MNLEVELHRRLTNWSFYALDDNGYPNKSTIADFGLVDSHVRHSKPPFPINNLQADEMNGWINIMGLEHPEYKKVIGAHYLRCDDLRITDLARLLNIKPWMFKQRLREARIWLIGRLSIDF